MNTREFFRSAACALLALAVSATAQAALTDISSVPLNTYSAPSSTDVKPNIMLILDDSGSMAWTHMPDNSADPGSAVPFTYGFYGYRSSQCNGVYYNPAITYNPPAKADGTYYPNATFTAAWNDGYNSGGGTTNLSTSFRAEGDSSNHAAYYYRYTGSQTTATQKNYYVANTFVNECGTASGSGTATSGTTPGSSVFQLVTVGAAEQQNFANWYSYYRTRILMMKTSSGLAFKDIDSRFRVGYMSINGDFLNIAEFTPSNKSAWYSALYGASPGGSTPLRTALSNAGRMYAGKVSTINGVTVTDPMQYSCQQNYAILSTDGFWNTGNGYKLDGTTTVGNEDAALARPYFDGGSSTVQQRTSTLQSQTSQLQSSTSTLQTQTSTLLASTSSLLSSTSSLLSSTSTLLSSTGTLQGTLNKVLMRCNHSAAICGAAPATGIANANWSIVASGSCTAAAAVQCAVVSGIGTLVNVAASCNTAGDVTVSNGSIAITVSGVSVNTRLNSIKIDGVEILTGQTSSANTNSGVATNIQAKVGNGFSAAVAGAVVTVSRSTITTASGVSSYNVSLGSGTLTAAAASVPAATAIYTLASADSNGRIYSNCAYAWTADAPDTACTYVNPSSTPNNTTTLTAKKCSYTAWSAAAPATSCTYQSKTTATTDGTVYASAPAVCSYTAWSAAAPAASCTYQSATTATTNGTVYNAAPAICSYTAWSAAAPAASCTAQSQTTSTSNGTVYNTAPAVCSYTAWSGWTDATAACTAVAQSTSGAYNATARQCQYTAFTTPALVASCTSAAKSTSSPYTQLVATTCSYTAASPLVNVSSCTAAAASTSSPYTVATATTCQYSSWSSWATVPSCTALAQSTAPNYTVATAVGCQTSTSGGSSDSLADVAAYYYNTDLRDSSLSNCTGPIIAPATTPNDLCANNVPSNGRDVASTQHMTTFTVGLGVRGRMVYSPTYWSDTSGDFWDVWKGTTASAGAGICSWQAGGTCNWPGPGIDSSGNGNIENVDDLWHASVNGHGTYFAATDPDSLTSGLNSLLTTIINTPRPGTAAAAASSNPNISSSDNYVFSSSYKSVDWFGELIRQQIDASTGALSAEQWSAMTQLDTKVQSGTATRTIYTNVSGALTAFQWASLTSSQQAYFKAPYLTYTSATAGLSQFCSSGGTCLNSTQQSNTTAASGGAAGENLINFLRGDRSNEGSLYRARAHVLGDIVSSEARYVKTTSSAMVYVAANDGMLHAFDATTGDETWAYIPSFVLPNLYKLADMNYSTQHQFFVDGSPEVGDIFAGSAKTILVGGLRDGGKGYYALNITDPAHPSLMWEFTDANMGFSYGNPRITKLGGTSADAGTWVVILTSGYNNADGKGHLYVLNANTGALIRDISTGVGSAGSPSGLARVSAQAVSAADNTVKAVYGGDLLGNLWRFDVNGNIGAPGYEAQLLVSFKDAAGNAEPVTAKPTVATIDGNPVVYIGTGIFLGTSDISSTSQQTFYAVKDKLDTTTYASPRSAGSNFVAQAMVSTTCPSDAPSTVCTPGQVVRGVSSSGCQAMDWSTNNGWYVDFLSAGERSTTDSSLGLGTLVFTTNTPNQANASACGSTSATNTSASFAYAMNYQTGCPVAGSSGIVGVSLGTGLATKGILGRLADGTVIEIIRTSGGSGGSGTDMGNSVVVTPPISSSGGVARRVSWRELVTE